MNNSSKKTKIAFVYDAIYPYIKGGAEKRYYEIGKRLAKKDYEVHIYGMKLWEGKDIMILEGMYLHGFCKAIPLYTIYGRRSIWQAIYFGFNCLRLLKEDFDVLEVNHMPFFSLFSTKLVALLKRKELFVTWNEVWGRKYWVEYMGIAGNIAYLIEWLSARLPDHIIAVSEHTKDKLIKDLGVKGAMVSVVNNGIDLEAIKKVNPSNEKSDVIYAGRLLSHKNIDYLIKSIYNLKKKYPNIKCIIIGNGPEESRLKQQVKKLKLGKNITFKYFLKQPNQLYALLKASKVFVFPSNREGFGIVALEANAAGIPVITMNHRNNAAKDLIIDGKNGYLFNKLDDLDKVILKALTVRKEKKYVHAVLKSFDLDIISKKVKKIYKL